MTLEVQRMSMPVQARHPDGNAQPRHDVRRRARDTGKNAGAAGALGKATKPRKAFDAPSPQPAPKSRRSRRTAP